MARLIPAVIASALAIAVGQARDLSLAADLLLSQRRTVADWFELAGAAMEGGTPRQERQAGTAGIDSLNTGDSRDPDQRRLYTVSLTPMERAISYFASNQQTLSGTGLLRTFQDAQADADTRATAARRLGRMGFADAVIPMVEFLDAKAPVSMTQRESQYVRYHVIQALGDLADRRAVPALLQALSDGACENDILYEYVESEAAWNPVRGYPIDFRSRAESRAWEVLYDWQRGKASEDRMRRVFLEAYPEYSPRLKGGALPEDLMLEEAGTRRAARSFQARFVAEVVVPHSYVAADALGKIGDSKALGPLETALRSEDPLLAWIIHHARGGSKSEGISGERTGVRGRWAA